MIEIDQTLSLLENGLTPTPFACADPKMCEPYENLSKTMVTTVTEFRSVKRAKMEGILRDKPFKTGQENNAGDISLFKRFSRCD